MTKSSSDSSNSGYTYNSSGTNSQGTITVLETTETVPTRITTLTPTAVIITPTLTAPLITTAARAIPTTPLPAVSPRAALARSSCG
ncbi:hypothetical protein D9757_013966 [Collybiopsis confluens]|uniref:Uncharacterized protein n=1 Tax=Collybiopsis confluens TaxID=2823264 RepID=A0A8H5FPU6_9AGAR|nr:hypothetical protein D9757_013966 [Collybiopsis confluens]